MTYKSLMISSIAALTVFLCNPSSVFAVLFATADDFAVLGGATVTNTGPSIVTGNLGVHPGSAVVGFDEPGGPGVVNGEIHAQDAVALQAWNDGVAVWNGLKDMPFTDDITGEDLGNRTLTTGVYHFDTSAQLTGALVLDAQDLDDAFWVFQIGTALTTASLSSVTVINPGLNNGIFWQVGSSATLGTETMFLGNILADQSITLTTAADILCGRAFGFNGAVTMDTNEISALCGQDSNHGFSGGLEFDETGEIIASADSSTSIPEPATMALLGFGLAGLGLKRQKSFKRN